MPGIVRRLDANFGRVALVVEIAFRIGVGHGFAAGADKGCRALHFAARSIRDLGF